MKRAAKFAFGSFLVGSALALSFVPAAAYITCNGGECWHSRQSYVYPPEAKVLVHPDDWRWRPEEHYVWHEHEGRGYWENGTWREF